MRRRCVTVLAWLLIAAVPMQGYAAATMINCGSRQHGAAEHQGHDSNPSHHHAGSASNIGDSVETNHDRDGTLSVKLSCSACAACCIGIGLPASTSSQLFAVPPSPLLFEPSGPPVGTILVGLYRPPRFILV